MSTLSSVFVVFFFLKIFRLERIEEFTPVFSVARIVPENSDYAPSIKMDAKRISWNPGQFNLNIRFLPFVLASRGWNPGSTTATDRNRKQHAYLFLSLGEIFHWSEVTVKPIRVRVCWSCDRCCSEESGVIAGGDVTGQFVQARENEARTSFCPVVMWSPCFVKPWMWIWF